MAVENRRFASHGIGIRHRAETIVDSRRGLVAQRERVAFSDGSNLFVAEAVNGKYLTKFNNKG